MTPLLLLDVDGVLNALPSSDEDLSGWPEWESGWARVQGTRYPITFAPPVIRQLREWHQSGALEIQWLTTWGHDANDELRRLLGLPELVVAGTYDPDDPGRARAVAGDAHAQVAPSAPDPLSGRWWKYDVVRRVLSDFPGRTVIWVDDELHRPDVFRTWAEGCPDLVPIGPHHRSGLTEQDLETIRLLTQPGAR